MSSEDVLLKIDIHYCDNLLGECNFIFPNSAMLVNSSIWGSDSDSGNNGCLEKAIDL